MKQIKLGEMDRKTEIQLEKILATIQRQLGNIESQLQEKCKKQAKNYLLEFIKEMK